MYLFHNTTLDLLETILSENYIKSLGILINEGKTNIISEGDGVYTTNKFIYFGCIEKLFAKEIFAKVILYFDPKISLANRKFFVSTVHSSTPDNLMESNNDYKRGYKRGYKNYNSVLKNYMRILLINYLEENHFKYFNRLY
jgi:hypothetical protein